MQSADLKKDKNKGTQSEKWWLFASFMPPISSRMVCRQRHVL